MALHLTAAKSVRAGCARLKPLPDTPPVGGRYPEQRPVFGDGAPCKGGTVLAEHAGQCLIRQGGCAVLVGHQPGEAVAKGRPGHLTFAQARG